MGTKSFAAVLCATAVAGIGASAALAGEVKGAPYAGAPVAGGIANETNSTGAAAHASSLCAFSGLNDYDSNLGQNSKPTQTPADAPPGEPGLGVEVNCRGTCSAD